MGKRAKIESTKGDYGFIAFKVEGRTPSECQGRTRGESISQENTGNLFFHSTELVDTDMNEITIGDLVEFDVVHIKRTNKYCAAKIRVVEKNRNPVTPSRIRTKSRNHPSISNYAEYMINDPRDRFNSLSAKNGENGGSQGLTREFSGGSFFDRQRSINERQKRDSMSRISPNNGQMSKLDNNFHQNHHHQQQQNSRVTNNSITSTLQGSNTGSMSDIPNNKEASKYKSKKENS